MTATTLLLRSLRYHWRTNLAVVLGVATAVAVLAGALVVGDSVRGSLRKLVLGRLGATDTVIAATNPFRAVLAGELTPDAYPLFALEGIVSHGTSGRVAGKVAVYGVDEGFWRFHQAPPPDAKPSARTVLVSGALWRELAIEAGDPLVVRLGKPAEIPAESLHGRKEETVRTMRLTAGGVLPEAQMGEFALRPTQSGVRAVFVERARLERELAQTGKANVILLRQPLPEGALRAKARLEDLSVRVKRLSVARQLSVESASMVVPPALEAAVQRTARELGMRTAPVMTYLVNAIRANGREAPYSLVTALESVPDGLILNEWAAADLGAKPGDEVTLEYYLWKEDGILATEQRRTVVRGVTPIRDWAADRDYAPDYPGITEAKTIGDWDPPFPMDLAKIRKKDEDYWERYRTTPKAFLPLAEGQKLWTSRYGRLTSIRVIPPEQGGDLEQAARRVEAALLAKLDPAAMGMLTVRAREDGLKAAEGSTDFGQYFLYFSFFLMVSALLLVGLFFRLGVEQRYREAGLLRALGFPVDRIGRLYRNEGAVVAGMGAVLGGIGAAGYAALILHGLRTWWVDAVGTTLLRLHVGAGSLALGAIAGWLTALLVIWRSLRLLREPTPRALLHGEGGGVQAGARDSRLALRIAWAFLLAGLSLLGAAAWNKAPAAGGFFGAGSLLLVAALAAQRVWLGRGVVAPVTVWRLGMRNATWRAGRSVLSTALIALATFLVIALSAFRQQGAHGEGAKLPGAAGFQLVGESVLPVVFNPDTPQGRENLGFPGDAEALFTGVRVAPLRLRPGEDASCLNLYEPRNPRVLALPDDVLFRLPLSAEKLAPGEGEIGAFVDANSLQYVLHKKVGDEIRLGQARLRILGTIRDSIFQSELVIREADFLRAFPEQQGFRYFLVEAPADKLGPVTTLLEERLKDYGLDLTSTAERLASYHRVENAYLSTFQALGGLGLLLGTVGLAAVLLRNVLERRRELGLLRAVGYRRGHLAQLVLAENVLLLAGGLSIGTACAGLAIAPALAERGGHLPLLLMAGLLAAVAGTGLLASVAAVRIALSSSLLESLRAE